MDNRSRLREIFEDTESWYQKNERLRNAVQASIASTKVYEEGYNFPEERESKRFDTQIKVNRAKTFEAVIEMNDREFLVLGAFGCGAFQNRSEIVARAYKETLSDFKGKFREIEFAVYCTPRDSRNFEIFQRVLGKRR